MDNKRRTFHRPLSIDFNSYTDGDSDFKHELISHLIGNIKELQQSLSGLDPHTSINFTQVLHKVKTTVMMLDDVEFTGMIEELKAAKISNYPLEFFKRKIELFNILCDQLVESLAAESTN